MQARNTTQHAELDSAWLFHMTDIYFISIYIIVNNNSIIINIIVIVILKLCLL